MGRWRALAARLAGAALSGALISIAISPSWLHRATGFGLDLGALAWVGLVPLLLALRGADLAATLAIGAIWELGAFGLTTSWGGLVSWPGWIAALLFFLPHHLLLAILLRFAARRGSRGMPLACAAFVSHEFARARIPIEVPWAFLSHTQIDLPVIGAADLAGAWLLTAILVAANYSVFLWRIRGRPAWIAAGPALLAASAAYGLLRDLSLDTMPGPVVGIVQGDMPAPVTSRGWEERMGMAAELAEKLARAGAEIIVVSESAVPLDMAAIERGEPEWSIGAPAARRLIGAGTAGGRSLLIQAYETEADGRSRNRSILYEDGARADAYEKIELVPFGEYIPLGGRIPVLARMTIEIAGYLPDTVPGDRPRPLRARPAGRSFLLGPLICFESVFPQLARGQARAGAEILVNQANDEWFAGSAQPEQSFRTARLRAIECRRPCVRAANRGISGWIDARGRAIGILEREGRRTGTWAAGARPIPLSRSASLYVLAGDWLPWASIAWIVAAIAAAALRGLTGSARAPYDALPRDARGELRRREGDGE